MGRAMIIICSGLIVALGYTTIGTNNQAGLLTATNAGYANHLKAQNTAQIATQFAIEKINEDTDFVTTYDSEANAWDQSIDGAETSLWIEIVSQTTNDSGLQDVVFRINANSAVEDQQANVISLYEKKELHFVPEFTSALSFTNDNFTFSMKGNASLNGADPSEGCEEMPGIITPSASDSAKIADNSNGQIQGNPALKVDTDTEYTSAGKLITYLEDMPGITDLSGNYMKALGDSTNPGIFFVDAPTDIKSNITEGYGILVIREEGRLYYNGNTDISEQLTFSGLVVFEDARNFKTETTPSINGSVIAGTTESMPTRLDVVLDGNLQINYDCNAPKYARMASSLIFDEDEFNRLVTFE